MATGKVQLSVTCPQESRPKGWLVSDRSGRFSRSGWGWELAAMRKCNCGLPKTVTRRFSALFALKRAQCGSHPTSKTFVQRMVSTKLWMCVTAFFRHFYWSETVPNDECKYQGGGGFGQKYGILEEAAGTFLDLDGARRV